MEGNDIDNDDSKKATISPPDKQHVVQDITSEQNTLTVNKGMNNSELSDQTTNKNDGGTDQNHHSGSATCVSSMEPKKAEDCSESGSSSSQLLPEVETIKESSSQISEKLEIENDKIAMARDVPAVAEDSGCQMEEGGGNQPSSATHPEDGRNLSSGESSPVSSQGQDSGLSPDEVMSEHAEEQTSPAAGNGSNATEVKPSPEESELLQLSNVVDSHPKPSLEESKLQEVVSPSGHASPEGSGGMSETQVTVSDLDSPSSPTVQPGGATAVANTSGSTDIKTDAEPWSATASAAAAVAASSSPSGKDEKEMESVYYIKWITFDGSSVPIITQNENGPCPLLALVNVLLLKGKVKLAPMLEMITSEQLMTYLGECILENTPKDLPETTQANYEQNMQDAIGVMHKLQTGLDVNVKFTGVSDFEYTPELIVFDLLGISLFHGWLVDPQDIHTVEAVNQCSYNQLVEKIILLKHSEKEEMVTQALTAEQFLERSASQLTYHGLAELSSVVKENELCVFFRNNHFNSLYRHNNELFLLVTDQGFLTESQVVWETLSNVEGDCHFTDATFRTYTKPTPSTEPILPDPNVAVGSPEQIDHDYQVALFLQEEAAASANAPSWTSSYPQEQMPSMQADHDLAMRLQEEENRREALQAQHASGPAQPAGYQYPHQQQQQWARNQGHHPQQPPQSAEAGGQRRRGERREKEDKSCVIL